MNTEFEASHRFAEIALGALKQSGLACGPRNYELWYAHVEGGNSALSNAMQQAMDKSGKLSQDKADRLYKEFIQHAEVSNDVMDLVARFHAEVSDLYDIVEQTGENAQGHSQTLTDISDQLSDSQPDVPAVGMLLENIVTIAKSMRAENELLETRLAESASEVSALQRDVEAIQAEAMRDALTGVANRATFDRSLLDHIEEAIESDAPLTLLLGDIDRFKLFNDTWGHQTGDQVLRLVADVMNNNVKGQDLVARYGGEEFAVILPDTSLQNAKMLANRIREAVQSRRLKKRRTNEDLGVVTMSIGVAQFDGNDSVESLVERADKCLYAAKDAGRNCVIDEQEFAGRGGARAKGAA
ncbi:GGDEF domain-containing protein [Hyphococcus sp.]|uniref:GGDEF domain-containing protein n=1 Tax=Hyphococcus sp. TaxID=2038636 RepID=UPI003CCC1CBE